MTPLERYLAAKDRKPVREVVEAVVGGSAYDEGMRAPRYLPPGSTVLVETAMDVGPDRPDLARKLEKRADLFPKIRRLCPRVEPLCFETVIQRNAFSQGRFGDGASGTGLYYYMSFFNHSCWPNCVWDVVEGVATVRTVESVEEGQELFISYVDITEPCGMRQAATREIGFTCACPRCTIEQTEPVPPRIDETIIHSARALYRQQLYEEAISMLNQVRDSELTPAEFDRIQLRSSCWIALQSQRFVDDIQHLLALLAPYRMRSPLYLHLLLKANDLDEALVSEVLVVSDMMYGGGAALARARFGI